MIRKEIGKWLMDVAKYVVTAVVLSTFFSEIQEERFMYLIALAISIVVVVVGLYLQKEPVEKERK